MPLAKICAKAAKDVKVGDVVSIKFLTREAKYEVLAIPTTKSIPKSAQSEYAKEL